VIVELSRNGKRDNGIFKYKMAEYEWGSILYENMKMHYNKARVNRS
jgi:hypothetical protein